MSNRYSRPLAIFAIAMFLEPAFPSDTPPAAGCSVPQMPSWILTKDDLAKDVVKSLNLTDALQPMLGAEYPSEDLFAQALTYKVPGISSPEKATVVGAARKLHCPDSAPRPWQAQSAVRMIQLRPAPYGFYTFWQDAKGKVLVDFNSVQRVGWFGVTFGLDGSIAVPPALKRTDSPVPHQVALARRFHTPVDLVFYLPKRGLPDQAAWNNREELANQIADLVGQPLDGFLNRFQTYFLLPSLRFSPTAWDGVTLFLDDYPFDNADALEYLTSLLRAIRKKLLSKEVWPFTGMPSGHPLALNLVVPFCDVVSDPGEKGCNLAPDSPAGNRAFNANLTIRHLSQLVPSDQNDVNIAVGKSAVVDRFIVFLPQPTTDTKKKLRQSIEEAISQFETAPVTKSEAAVSGGISVASWRLQILRRIVCVLSPATWNWTGSFYKTPGTQFFDDMVYFRNNFSSAGFWPLPTYAKSGDMADLATQARKVFETPSEHMLQERVALRVVSLLGIDFTNIFGERRRELGLFVEGIFALLALLGVGSCLFFEIEAFCRRRIWWLFAAASIAFATGTLMLLFDPALSPYAGPVFGGAIGSIILLAAIRQFIMGRLEKDLP